MSKSHKIAILGGTGFISDFYTSTLHSQRALDRVHTVYSRSIKKGNIFKEKLLNLFKIHYQVHCILLSVIVFNYKTYLFNSFQNLLFFISYHDFVVFQLKMYYFHVFFFIKIVFQKMFQIKQYLLKNMFCFSLFQYFSLRSICRPGRCQKDVQGSTNSRDLGILLWSFCRPGRRQKDVLESTIYRDLGIVF